jgi:hypothetical protein
MNEHDNKPSVETTTPQAGAVDEARRRITRGGAAGAGVLISVASRSAFGTSTWGTCTGSELASGNLSRDGAPRPCGCSPGYWKSSNPNGTAVWNDPNLIPATYGPGQSFNTIFGVTFFKASDGVTLRNAVDKTKLPYQQPGGWCPTNKASNMQNVAFHAVAALLNAQFYGSRYPVTGLQSPTSVITAFQNAFNTAGTITDKINALTAFMTKVNIYATTTDLWCNGAAETGTGA